MRLIFLHCVLKTLREDCATLAAMAVASVCCGLAANAIRDVPLPWVYASKTERIMQAAERLSETAPEEATKTAEMIPATVSGVRAIDLATFREIQGQALVLDARPEIFHRYGHIPKALSLPREDFESSYNRQRPRLEKHKAHAVVIYCSGGHCEDGESVAGALIKLGFTQVYFFKGGWHEWTRARLPEEKL